MFDKIKVQEALSRIDIAVAQLNLKRQNHIQLIQDMRLLNECCMDYFDDEQELKETRIMRLEDGRANINAEHVEPCDENIEGSGNGVSGD